MNGTWVTFQREIKQMFRTVSGAVPVAVAVSVASAILVWTLRKNEGGGIPLQTVWGLGTAIAMQILAATAAVRLVAEERSTGMLELLFSSPVSERELVVGKFLALWTTLMLIPLISVLAPVVILPRMAAVSVSSEGFVLTGLILVLQSAFWSAGAVFIALCCGASGIAAGAITLLCFAGVPFFFYNALLNWFPEAAGLFSGFMMREHISDFSTGLISLFPLVLYPVLTLLLLLLGIIRLENMRQRGLF